MIVRYAAGSCLLLDPPEATVGPTGSLTSQQVEVFDSSGAPVTFTIESGSSWVVVDEGSVTEDGFEFEVHNNPGIMPRDASIVVTASDGRVAVLPIHQGAPCEMIDSEDCDLDGVPDLCEILWGTASDVNLDGIPDECQSPTGDLNQDGRIDGADLTILLAEWGSESSAFADVNADGVVDGADLTILLANWGP